ncbi:hypothetical protein CHGG_08306 [Chaetomium globosum CBS 148.51]|uniref:protein-tyrosine-phosphatase n=1 Tax=Chaetomium globosum (strain ATCC 6205 / CBS 148.51 / DSM 1962 / NBRC 6347 / NRRL 1970) TaxID=306901 RepID=Q2GUP8_CHAGB|nr:uncharacterized protein CHGG_08306 [Chaetomium globosum CBS 148.51]EAQ87053.1 hypothetical protein CHGG_08306 [Chaetomium globosum CBS 148.51]
MPSDHRATDRPSYYTMTTPAPVSAVSPQGLSHSRSNSQSYINNSKPTVSPMPSPRPPPGQPHPPKLSPGAARGAVQDARSSSPNYFGLAADPAADPRDSCLVPRENWSSPSSSVKSFSAAIPKQLPLDANPEFEAFRRQIDANRARTGFSLSTSHFNISTGGAHTPPASTPSALQRPRPPRWHTQGGDSSDIPFPRPRIATGSFSSGDVPGTKFDKDAHSLQEDSAYVSADSKRSSAVSLNPPFFPNMGRHEISPPKLPSPFSNPDRAGTSHPTSHTNDQPSLQPIPRGKAVSLSPGSSSQNGVVAAPQTQGTSGPALISPTELKDMLEDQDAKLLLLDLRVSPQFAQSRVRGALNLCIPTTLLKRATFNLQKLQQTFQADQDQEKFSSWRDASHLVVYDASSSDKRDAVSAINMIKKFTNEGYSGPVGILRGGFNAFAASYPALIDRSSGGPSPGLSLGSGPVSGGLRANLPPVIGGVVLPNASHNPSPFFNNIRQNQDLVDGVGQIDIGVPAGLTLSNLPRWLRDAAESGDHGKKVSDKFLRIERTEQSRMREAYSVVGPADIQNGTHNDRTKVQLSGIEKGGKNRYKDILPFEHARVRLTGRPEGTCDYVNASYLQAKRSHKRYIASQGPLPATFEDFWSVVWDNDVRVIVMLTAESEGGQLKCHPYWKGNDFGPVKLRVLSEKKISLDIDKRKPPPTAAMVTTDGSASTSSPDALPPDATRRRANTTTTLGTESQTANHFMFPPQAAAATETPHVIVRTFALSHAAHPFSPIREVTQLHYPSWPDFGAPAQPSHLLALVELANIMQRGVPPRDAPGNLTSAPVPRQNNGLVSDSASNPFFADHDSGRDSSAGLRRIDSDNMSLAWSEGPESQEHPRPLLVHCSAGCGRTGAFCTVDSVIDMLKRQKQHLMGPTTTAIRGRDRPAPAFPDSDGDISMNEGTAGPDPSAINQPDAPLGIDTSWLDDDTVDLIAQAVEDFRGQRLSMVQSLRQFVLCYETVLEWARRLQEDRDGGVDGKGRGRSGSLAF